VVARDRQAAERRGMARKKKEGGYGRWKKMERQWKTDVKTVEIRELGLELKDEKF